MDYEEFLQEVNDLEILPDRASAEAAVKFILGALAGRLEDAPARRLTKSLPEPLTFDKLRAAAPAETRTASAEEFVDLAAAQFKLEREDARMLVDTVLSLAKEAVDDETLDEIEAGLPEDWADLFMCA